MAKPKLRLRDHSAIRGIVILPKLSLFAALMVLLDAPIPVAVAHHCGPYQPLPEYPRHSCTTRRQAQQPGDPYDPHPGGPRPQVPVAGQGTGHGQSVHCQLIGGECVCGSPGYTGSNIPCRPEFVRQPQREPAPCVYYVDPATIEEMLQARPGVCQRYGWDQIICQNPGQVTDAGGRAVDSDFETWRNQLRDAIALEIETRAKKITGFDTTQTEILINFTASGTVLPSGAGPTRRPYSEHYWSLFNQVMPDFVGSGVTKYGQSPRPYTMTLVLPPPPPPTGTSQTECPPIQAGAQQTQLEGEVKQDAHRQPDSYEKPPEVIPPASQPQPAVVWTYGRLLRQPAGQTIWLPIDIEVPYGFQPSNSLRFGSLRAGPAGRYYRQFRGYLLRQWIPAQAGRREVFGSFQVTGLQTVNGAWETMNYTIPLSPIPPPAYQGTQ